MLGIWNENLREVAPEMGATFLFAPAAHAPRGRNFGKITNFNYFFSQNFVQFAD
jgi:hypothetical protein